MIRTDIQYPLKIIVGGININYKNILDNMTNQFISMTGVSPDDASDIGIRFKVISGELEKLYTYSDSIKDQIFPQTANDEFLLKHGENRNIFPFPAKASSGTLTFSRSSPAIETILIPKGTVVTSSFVSGISFITDENVSIPKGSSSVSSIAHSDIGGKNSNIASKKIDTILSSIPGVSSVSNIYPFSGGIDKETNISFRKRLLNSFVNISNGINLSFYENFAMKFDYITSALAEMKDNSINLYITNSQRNILPSQISTIQQEFKKYRPINYNIIVKQPTPRWLECDITVYASNPISEIEIKNSVVFAIEQYTAELDIGESFSPYKAGQYILSIPNIVDYKFNNPPSTIKIPNDYVFVPDVITVNYRSL